MSGCIPPDVVSRLLERGRAEVVEEQAGRGEWFCALAWARLLGEQGRQADAREVLAPYLATGWWTAVSATAELLEGWGRVDEAIEITRVRMEAGHPDALAFYARLLARHGRAEEAFVLLRPHVGEWSPAEALVDVAGAAGCDEEAAELLIALTEHECSDFPFCCRGLDRYAVIEWLSTVRERQGRTEEAIALLRTGGSTLVNGGERLAAMLGRNGRLDELREFALGDGADAALSELVRLLEEDGDVEGAVTACRRAVATDSTSRSAYELAQLLARHGRWDEAIAVMRVPAEAYPGDDCILHTLSVLYLDADRPRDGLECLDALAAARAGEEAWDLYWIRLPLIAACDGVDAAIAQARSHAEGGTWYAAEHVAELLAGAGRVEEAVAVLEEHAPDLRHDLARHLVDLGRVEEALALLQRQDPRPLVAGTGPWCEEPPF
ncbi:hypothetical protein SSPIM334S_04168 [Streptomyces spiroverticillatus]